MYQVFISYRREGGEFLGKMLYDALSQKGYSVFYDVEALRSGDFNEQIFRRIDECQDFLLILSLNALDRCVNPDDWVRKELSYALKTKKRVIPVMTRNFKWPDNLPSDIAQVSSCQALNVLNEYFDAAVEKLCRDLLLSRPKSTSAAVPELETKSYYKFQAPIFSPYKKNASGACFRKLEAFLGENYRNVWVNEAVVKKSSSPFKDAYSEIIEKYKSAGLAYACRSMSDDVFAEVEILREKIRTIRMNDRNRTYFLRDFVFYFHGTFYTIPTNSQDVIAFFIEASMYIYDLNHSLAEELGEAYGEDLSHAFHHNLPLFIDVWGGSYSPRDNVDPSEKREFVNQGIALFDAIIDAAILYANVIKDSRFILGLRCQLLCYNKYLNKNGIFLPKEIQKKLYVF